VEVEKDRYAPAIAQLWVISNLFFWLHHTSMCLNIVINFISLHSSILWY
jgi:hypothetical protein